MKETSLSFASIGAAIIASLCCIGPLIAVVLGLGTFGATAAFEKFRPLLLGITALLLGDAFYVSYRPSKTSACVEGACVSNPTARRSKVLLWIATAVVALFAAFPYYSPLIWKTVAYSTGEVRSVSSSSQVAAPHIVSLHLLVEGMTCSGCAAAVQSSLSQLKGVSKASVRYEETAFVEYDPSLVTPEQLIRAVERAGYKARVRKANTQ